MEGIIWRNKQQCESVTCDDR